MGNRETLMEIFFFGSPNPALSIHDHNFVIATKPSLVLMVDVSFRDAEVECFSAMCL